MNFVVLTRLVLIDGYGNALNPMCGILFIIFILFSRLGLGLGAWENRDRWSFGV